MKKFQILGTVLLLSVVTILLVACQKEQDGVTNEVNNKSGEELIRGIEVNASDIPGIIDQNEASKLASNYKAANMNATESVKFSVKDIQNYLNLLKKQGSENIYVNFGIYNTNDATNGRLTVFFSGDRRTRSGSVRGNNAEKETEYLNHGGLLP